MRVAACCGVLQACAGQAGEVLRSNEHWRLSTEHTQHSSTQHSSTEHWKHHDTSLTLDLGTLIPVPVPVPISVPAPVRQTSVFSHRPGHTQPFLSPLADSAALLFPSRKGACVNWAQRRQSSIHFLNSQSSPPAPTTLDNRHRIPPAGIPTWSLLHNTPQREAQQPRRWKRKKKPVESVVVERRRGLSWVLQSLCDKIQIWLFCHSPPVALRLLPIIRPRPRPPPPTPPQPFPLVLRFGSALDLPGQLSTSNINPRPSVSLRRSIADRALASFCPNLFSKRGPDTVAQLLPWYRDAADRLFHHPHHIPTNA